MLAEILDSIGVDAAPVLARMRAPEIKARLRETTERAAVLGIFGAPSLTCNDGELYWGNDRLESAFDRAARR